jgi:hypothetical protein
LPLLSSSISGKTPNLAVGAVFALLAISLRPDGGAILQSRAAEVASMLANPDERLSGGGVTILRNLTRSIPETTVPLLLAELRAPRAPSLVTAEIVRTLLESSRGADPGVQRSVDTYLALPAPASVKAANLYAVASNRITTPGISALIMSSMDDKDKHVQIAAIEAACAVSRDLRNQARATFLRLSNDPNADAEVRAFADRAARNTLTYPDRRREAPGPPQLKGVVP